MKIIYKNPITTALIAVLIASYFLFIATFGVNVPFWDDWNLVAILSKIYQGQMHWLELLKSNNNEHLTGVSFTLMAFLSLISKYNILAFLYTSAVLQLLSCFILIGLYQKEFTERTKKVWIVSLIIIFLSLCQVKNILWAFQLTWYFVTFFMMLALACIDIGYTKKGYARQLWFAGFVLFATLASFSSLQGIFVWFSGFLYVWCKEDFILSKVLKTKRFYFLLTSSVIVAFIFIYAWLNRPLSGSIAPAFDIYKSFLIFIGLFGEIAGNLKTNGNLAVGIFIWSILLIGIYKIKLSSERHFYALPLSLIAFGILVTATTAIGRSYVGFEIFEEPRYSIYVLITLAGLLCVLLRQDATVGDLKIFNRSVFIFLLVLAVATINSTYKGINFAIEWQKMRGLDLQTMLNDERASDMKLNYRLCWDASFARKNIQFLKTYKLSAFQEGSSTIPKSVLMYAQMAPSLVQLRNSLPNYQKLIDHSWEIYLIAIDLQKVFHPLDPDFAIKFIQYLLSSSKDMANEHYMAKYYKPYAKDYEALWHDMEKQRNKNPSNLKDETTKDLTTNAHEFTE